MFLHLSPEDSMIAHPTNQAWDFTVDVGEHIDLSGRWQVALTEIIFDGGRNPIY